MPKWDTPVDFGKTWNQKKIFGSHKTYRGLVSGILMGMLIFYIQQKLYTHYPVLKSLSYFDYSSMSPWLGAWMGFSALVGDLVKSFFKRRFNIEPGNPWIPFDEIDWILGLLAGISFVFVPGWNLVLASLAVGVSLHFIIRRIGYLLHFVPTPL